MSQRLLELTNAHQAFVQLSSMLKKEDAIRTDRKMYKRDNRITYIFKCKGYLCENEIRIQAQYLKKLKGFCRRCCQKGLPFHAKYNELKRTCIRRHHEITLTYEEFIEFTKIKNCHYCCSEIEWQPFTKDIKDNKVVSRSYRLDRTNNDLGYTKENCVVCCWRCNSAKGDRYTYDEWFAMTALFRNKRELSAA